MPKKKPEKSLEQMLEEALVKEDEQPYEVPGNWEWTRPTSLTEQLRGVTYKKKDAGGQPEEGKSLILRAGNLQEGEFITDHDCVYVANDLISNIQQLIVGDVVVVGSSGSKSIVGKAAQVKKAMPNTSFGAFLTLFRPNNLINSKYYGWFFQSKYYRDTISMLSAGININNIKREHFESLHFPLPPLPEQKRIVQKLSSMLGKLKEAKELIQEAKETFEERRAAILNKAFTGELTKKWREENPDVENTFIEANELKGKPYLIPATWKWIEFCDLTKETKIGLVRSVKEQSNSFKYAYLKMNNITIAGTLDINDITKVNASKDEVQAYSLKDGDLLFNTRNSFELVGKNTVFKFFHKENVLFNNNIMRIRFLPDVYPKLISHFLNSTIGKLLLNGIKKCTTNVAAIYAKNLNTTPIPLPPKEEQKEIVQILEKLLDHENGAKALIDMEEQIDLLEKSILSKAFRGELGTNDPSDEPAIDLLKRSLKEKNE